MTSPTAKHAPPAGGAPQPIDEVDKGTSEALREHGIVSTQHTSYEWNGFRYSNSSDAIAAAKRSKR